MSLRLSAAGVLERVSLKGVLAVQAGDALVGTPSEFPCRVTALRTSDGKAVQVAVPHPAGVSGFLTLRAGGYHIRVEPEPPGYLPSLRSATVSAPPITPQFLSAYLRPSPVYPTPPNAVLLRGTLQWGPAPPPTAPASLPPVRWALVYATLLLSGTTTVVSTMWTRSNARGEFLLILPSQPPSSDGVPVMVSARVEVFAAPAPPPADPSTLDDLPLDDGDDAAIRAAAPQPARRILLEPGLSAGVELSMNQDSYSFTPPGSAQPVDNRVILL